MRPRIKRCEHLAAFARKAQNALTSIVSRFLPLNQALPLKVAQHTAQISGIESEIIYQSPSRKMFAMREFVEHPDLCERKFALVEALLQYSDLAGVKAVEVANGSDVFFQWRNSCRHKQSPPANND